MTGQSGHIGLARGHPDRQVEFLLPGVGMEAMDIPRQDACAAGAVPSRSPRGHERRFPGPWPRPVARPRSAPWAGAAPPRRRAAVMAKGSKRPCPRHVIQAGRTSPFRQKHRKTLALGRRKGRVPVFPVFGPMPAECQRLTRKPNWRTFPHYFRHNRLAATEIFHTTIFILGEQPKACQPAGSAVGGRCAPDQRNMIQSKRCKEGMRKCE
jgi:hypothetical protein